MYCSFKTAFILALLLSTVICLAEVKLITAEIGVAPGTVTGPLLNASIEDLSDVAVMGPALGDVLTWDGDEWTAEAAGGTPPWVDVNNVVQTDSAEVAQDTDDFVFGSWKLDDTGSSDNDSRFLFDKSQGFFAAGQVTGSQWDIASRGIQSAAFGVNNTVSGGASAAFGSGNAVSGDRSFAAGITNTVSGDWSAALGSNNTASGDHSFAVGADVSSVSHRSVALGNKITVGTTTDDATYSIGIGLDGVARTLTQTNTMAIIGGNVGIGDLTPGASLEVTGPTKFNGTTEITNGLIVDTNTLLVNGTLNRVGIGLTDPGALLEIKTATNNNMRIQPTAVAGTYDMELAVGNDAWNAYKQLTISSYTFEVATGSARRFMITPTGYVGIGTTAPDTTLHILDGGNAIIRLESSFASAGQYAGLQWELPAGEIDGAIYLQSAEVASDYNSMVFKTRDAAGAAGLKERMRIRYNGNVGIGTDAPSTLLHVNGEIRATGAAAAGVLTWTDTKASPATLGIYSGATSLGLASNETTIGNGVTTIMSFNSTNSNVIFPVGGGGNVGIGTTAPNYPLSVFAPAATTGQSILIGNNSNAIGAVTGIRFNNAASADNAYQKGAIFYERTLDSGRGDMKFCQDAAADNGAVLTSEVSMIIKNDGNVGIGTDAPGTTLKVAGSFAGKDATGYTIVSDAISASGLFFIDVDTEAAAATDTVETISDGVNGQIVILKAVDGTHTVVVKDYVSGSDNLLLNGDFTMDNNHDTITLINRGDGYWYEMCRSDNGS